jgi:uncharacterized protein
MVGKRISKNTIKIVLDFTNRLSKEENLPIKKVIVFGSHAKGLAQKWSDIDVCIISPKFKNTQKALEFLWTKRKKKEVLDGLEPIGFTEEDFKKSSGIIEEIKKTGVVIK